MKGGRISSAAHQSRWQADMRGKIPIRRRPNGSRKGNAIPEIRPPGERRWLFSNHFRSSPLPRDSSLIFFLLQIRVCVLWRERKLPRAISRRISRLPFHLFLPLSVCSLSFIVRTKMTFCTPFILPFIIWPCRFLFSFCGELEKENKPPK